MGPDIELCEIVATFNGQVIGKLKSIEYTVTKNDKYELSIEDEDEE